MLRAEDRAERHAVGRGQPIDDVREPAIDRRVIADDADARPAEPPRLQQPVGSQPDGGGHH